MRGWAYNLVGEKAWEMFIGSIETWKQKWFFPFFSLCFITFVILFNFFLLFFPFFFPSLHSCSRMFLEEEKMLESPAELLRAVNTNDTP